MLGYSYAYIILQKPFKANSPNMDGENLTFTQRLMSVRCFTCAILFTPRKNNYYTYIKDEETEALRCSVTGVRFLS